MTTATPFPTPPAMALGDGAMANPRGAMKMEQPNKASPIKTIIRIISEAFVFTVVLAIQIGPFVLVLLPFILLGCILYEMKKGKKTGSTEPTEQRRKFANFSNVNKARYDSFLRAISMQEIEGMSTEQAAKHFASWFAAGEKSSVPFFQTPYVQSVLGLRAVTAPLSANSSASGSAPKTKTGGASGGFWSNINEGSHGASSSDDRCAGPGCDRTVSAFDFRCFSCRERFCEGCKGNQLTCPSCS